MVFSFLRAQKDSHDVLEPIPKNVSFWITIFFHRLFALRCMSGPSHGSLMQYKLLCGNLSQLAVIGWMLWTWSQKYIYITFIISFWFLFGPCLQAPTVKIKDNLHQAHVLHYETMESICSMLDKAVPAIINSLPQPLLQAQSLRFLFGILLLNT